MDEWLRFLQSRNWWWTTSDLIYIISPWKIKGKPWHLHLTYLLGPSFKTWSRSRVETSCVNLWPVQAKTSSCASDQPNRIHDRISNNTFCCFCLEQLGLGPAFGKEKSTNNGPSRIPYHGNTFPELALQSSFQTWSVITLSSIEPKIWIWFLSICKPLWCQPRVRYRPLDSISR